MGLGTEDRNEKGTTFLNPAGGYLWDKKATKEHLKYKIQEYEFGDKTQERVGAAHEDLLGVVTEVNFTEKDFGRVMTFCNITFNVGGENYTISIKHNSVNSQAFYPALLTMDLDKPLRVKPYDFIPKGQSSRRSGISLYQDGKKLSKYDFKVPKEIKPIFNFWKRSSQKIKDRLNEDLSDWFRGEIEEKVRPKLGAETKPKKEIQKPEVEEKIENEVTENKVVKITPLKMKMYLKEYISENYEDKELPTLSKEDLKVWYDLAIEMEELPFDTEEIDDSLEDSEVDQDDVQAQLDALAGGM